MTDEELDRLQAVCDAVGEADWTFEGSCECSYLGNTLICRTDVYEDWEKDTSYIEAACQTFPALIAEVRRLKAAMRRMKDEILGTCGDALDYPLVNGYFVTGDHVPETIVASLAQQYLDALKRIETLENIAQERGDYD